ncbi:MAG: endo alpha-1,4 polygalactosaminidase [Hyphomicrobiaceae bacterium]
MSFAELLLILGLVSLAFAIGYVMGRASRKASPIVVPRSESLPPARRPAAPPPTTAPAGHPLPSDHEASPLPGPAGTVPRLEAARSWGYQLQDLNVKQAAASSFDVLVVDYARDGTDDTALEPADLARLQTRPDGSRRIVLAYLSIGEAESYRFYWRKEWSRKRPPWLLRENPDWDQNFAVSFWDPDWQALIYGGPEAYLDRIIAQGFDGIYLDKCDVTDDLRRREKKAVATRKDLDGDMIAFVRQLAAYARRQRPGFLIVMQNAEPLLERAELRAAIDAVAKEELLFGLDAAEKPNDADEVSWSRQRLDLMRRDGKPVFLVEYLDNAGKIAKAVSTASELGYVLYVSDKSRELDKLRDAPLVA